MHSSRFCSRKSFAISTSYSYIIEDYLNRYNENKDDTKHVANRRMFYSIILVQCYTFISRWVTGKCTWTHLEHVFSLRLVFNYNYLTSSNVKLQTKLGTTVAHWNSVCISVVRLITYFLQIRLTPLLMPRVNLQDKYRKCVGNW